MDQDFLAHELVHSYLHDQQTDKLHAEIEVEKVLVFYNSKLAKDSKSLDNQKQYLALANDHTRRYLLRSKEAATKNGEKFDAKSALQQLYEDYVKDYGNNQSYGKIAAMDSKEYHSIDSQIESQTNLSEEGGLESILSQDGESLEDSCESNSSEE